MRTFRTILTLWLCLSLPYTALASALRDPQCVEARAATGDVHSMTRLSSVSSVLSDAAMDSMPGMDHDGSTMLMPDEAAAPSHAHSAPHCGCLLGCACVQACAAPACNSGLDGAIGLALVTLSQESPARANSAQRRSSLPAEVFRPPALRV